MRATLKILVGIAFIGSFSNSSAQMITGSFELEGITRNYEVHLPQNFQANMPLVIALHGWGATIDVFKTYSVLHQFADTAGFIVAYPEGTDLSWNMGIKTCPIRGTLPTVDDVGFISALIDTLYSHYTIDMQRIYSCGYSTGGEMTLRLACQLGQRFAAVASVAGGLYDPAENWHPVRPMSILEFHGTKDDYSFYYHPDSTTRAHSPQAWSIPKSLIYWIEKNQCNSIGDTVALPDSAPGDLCTVQKITFSECSDSTEVLHYKIINGGHAWPGSPAEVPYFGTEGNRNMDISANAEIWNFFKNYQNPLANLAYGKSFEVYPTVLRPDGDTLYINAQLANPENHQVALHALIQGENTGFADSVQLFDDGLHHDGLADDNIFGGMKSFDELVEDYFDIKLRTVDSVESITSYCREAGRFTTIGPVTCTADSLALRSRPESNYYPVFYPTITNMGSVGEALAITATLSSQDTCVVGISKDAASFGDIAAGASVTGTDYFYIEFNENCDIGTEASFTLAIASGGYVFWHDTIAIAIPDLLGIAHPGDVLPAEFALHQNYPNPFNPVATIEYELPQGSDVSLIVYDILGREVARLVDGYIEPGYHQVQWDGREFASGIYIARLLAAEYSKSIKMVLLK
ncbi:MAG: T9SS type A sorting domain-containing protein [Fidelibacterota bacterium]|nr:MAG: T9SS type A sorting domain-containing protein [Candidatus Neomarinimicrobiota bacterium]